MKMRNILCNGKTGQRGTRSAVSTVGGHHANELNAVKGITMNDGATLDPIDRNTINEVSLLIVSPSAD